MYWPLYHQLHHPMFQNNKYSVTLVKATLTLSSQMWLTRGMTPSEGNMRGRFLVITGLQQRGVFSSWASQRGVFSPKASQRGIFSSWASQRGVFSPKASQRGVFSPKASQRGVFSSWASQGGIFSPQASQRGVFSSWAFSHHGLHRGAFSHHGDVSSGWYFIRLVSHQGGFFVLFRPRWSLIRVVFHQGGL